MDGRTAEMTRTMTTLTLMALVALMTAAPAAAWTETDPGDDAVVAAPVHDPFASLVQPSKVEKREVKPDGARRSETIIPPPIPDLKAQVMAVAAEGGRAVAVVHVEGEDYIVEPGFIKACVFEVRTVDERGVTLVNTKAGRLQVVGF
jgi:hypothetical protein